MTKALTLGPVHGANAAFQAAQIDAVVESARFFGWRLPILAFAHRR